MFWSPKHALRAFSGDAFERAELESASASARVEKFLNVSAADEASTRAIDNCFTVHFPDHKEAVSEMAEAWLKKNSPDVLDDSLSKLRDRAEVVDSSWMGGN